MGLHMHDWFLLRLALMLLAFGVYLAIAFVAGARDDHRDSTRQGSRARDSHRDGDGLLPH
jgi:hypothetical protein